MVLGNIIYRPPRQTVENINTFKDKINAVLNTNTLVTGDSNLDLLKCTKIVM